MIFIIGFVDSCWLYTNHLILVVCIPDSFLTLIHYYYYLHPHDLDSHDLDPYYHYLYHSRRF